MGWKISLIIIQNPTTAIKDSSLLQGLGFKDYTLRETTHFETALNTRDTVAVGEINGYKVICDGYKLTEPMFEAPHGLELSPVECDLVALFPESEILSVACHSVSDYHAYSLIEQSKKTRLKIVSPDEKIEFGSAFYEEQLWYQKAQNIEGELCWNLDESDNPDDFYREAQLMEEFTFGVLKRPFGLNLNEEDGESLFETPNFRIYEVGSSKYQINKENARVITWKRILLYIVIFLIYQLIRHYIKK